MRGRFRLSGWIGCRSVLLRPYQDQAVQDVRAAFAGHRSVLLVSPVGSGKTQIFSYIAKGVQQKSRRVLILAHRRELVEQITRALSSWGVDHGVIESGSKRMPRQSVLVGNVFSVVKRLDKIPTPDLIIGDEAHHFSSAADTTFSKIEKAFQSARLLGVTATPVRTGSGGLGDTFSSLILGPSVSELQALGFLSPTRVYAPSQPDLSGVHRRMGDYVQSELDVAMNKPRLTGSAVKHYLKLCPGVPALAFCVSVAHAKNVADEFNAAGVAAASVDGNMYAPLRDDNLRGLADGRIKVITSCDLISEGFDSPAVGCAILLRPTQSLGLFIQQVGRAVRIAPGKEYTTILDHASCTIAHGFLEDDREWTLDPSPVKKKGDKPPAVRTCARCFAAHRPAPVCPRCGFEYPIVSRTVEQVDGELALIVDPKRINRDELLQEPARAKEYSFMLRKAREKGYKDAWAWHVVAAKEAKRRMKRLSGGQ